MALINPPARPSSHEVLLRYAFELAKRSTCERGQVGCVLAKHGRPISVGYNGSPPGREHCIDPEYGCDLSQGVEAGCQRSIHAEMNAVAWAARLGLSVEGTTAYCTHAPCKACAQALTAAGIKTLYYVKDYRAARLDILQAQGISVYKIDEGHFE